MSASLSPTRAIFRSMTTVTHRIKTYWEDTPPIIRWLCCVLIPLGITTGTIGLYGDSHGWWEERSFLANSLSSSTGFLFGAPFALAVLSHLGRAQTEAIERRAARRQSSRALAEFRELVLEAFTESTRSDPKSALDQLHPQAIEVQRQAIALRDAYQPAGGTWRIEGLDRFSVALTDFHESCKQLFELGASMENGATWAGKTSAQWNILDSEIRPQVSASGLSWMTPETSFKIAQSIRAVERGPRPWFAGQRKALGSLTVHRSFSTSTQQWAATRGSLKRMADESIAAVRWLAQMWWLVDSLDATRAIESQHQS